MRLLRAAFVVSVFALAGCGTDDTSPSSKPLTGTIEGKKFTATSALALTGMDVGSKYVIIRDKKAECSDGSSASDGDLLVTLEVPWKSGTTSSLTTADVTVTLEAPPDRILATSGEVDVLHAPQTVGAEGVVRLLADALDDKSKVDGEVDVIVCQ